MKVRAGRGFSLEELKAAGIPKKLAPTITPSLLSSQDVRVRKFKAGGSNLEELATTYNSVWKAGGDGGLVDSSARFELLLNGNLRLTNGSGGVVWQSQTQNRGVTTAVLDDSGNLSLRNGSIIVWSSFENPTDTILPNQSFTTSMRLQSGSYSFSLLDVGNLTLRWNADTIYWNQALNSSFNGNLSSPTLRLQQIGILQLSDPMLAVPVNMAYSSDYGEGTDILRYLKLDTDGNLRIYSSDRGSGNSTERWAAVLDQCRVYGWCGNMGICSYDDSTPVCGCPSQNFELSDPRDSRKGCKRKMEIEDCPSSTTMLQLEHTEFLTYPPELSSQIFFVGISACRLNCLVGGSCVASTSLADGTGQCYLKGSTFISGYQSPALPSTSYIKVCGPVQPNPTSTSTMDTNQRSSKKLPAWVVGVVVVSTLVGLVLLEVGLWFWCCRNSPKFGGLSAQYALLEYASGAPVQFLYKELQRSTKGFKEKLGAGETNGKKFSIWAYEEFEKGNINSIVDKRLAEHEVDMEQAIRAIMVSFWCIQEQPSQRPTMGKVVQMLEGITPIDKPPVPKVMIDTSLGGTSIGNVSSISALSTFATSAPPLSSSSSSLQLGAISSVSESNLKTTSLI
ncbi:G-type lectin S-receptor-like serine/threonine-protein kinase [Thalictrum thalictroides]|uniref:60S ribosomal protein L13 n=1 Tax=Thalictrum thalictroides TaxID=46969 RepID=A0A7J6WWK5_THATH|nr:G-type lectin S-receptor-like serine/threonine-protein kinase [Thalictrum thalictroides]